MATDEAPINRLPFDCFSKVLGYLGRKDLLASVKTSQKFNDAASLLLYRSVEVLTLDDANNAIEAYERRPELADQTQSFMVEQSATFYHSLKAKWQFEAAANLKNVKTLCFSYKPLLSQYTKEGITLKEDYERHLREGAPLAYGRQQNSPVLKSCKAYSLSPTPLPFSKPTHIRQVSSNHGAKVASRPVLMYSAFQLLRGLN